MLNDGGYYSAIM